MPRVFCLATILAAMAQPAMAAETTVAQAPPVATQPPLAVSEQVPGASETARAQDDAESTEAKPTEDAASAPLPPDPLMDMVAAAVASGSDAEMDAVIKFASAQSPAQAAQFRTMAEARRKARADAQLAERRGASMLSFWDGQVELGGFRTTGNTDTVGLSGGVRAQREGVEWRHKLDAFVDYQKSAGITSRERYTGGYQTNYKFGPRTYIVGVAQYENDRFLGYDARYAGSLGLGYRALSGRMTLDIEAGPAIRHTRYTRDGSETAIAGRGSIDLDWKLNKTVALEQDVSLYADRINTSLVGTTSLRAKLFGPLSARFTYRVQFEGEPIDNRKQLDTLSRASLVYDF